MIDLDWAKTFYIVLALVLLSLSIAVYPTLKARSKRSHRK